MRGLIANRIRNTEPVNHNVTDFISGYVLGIVIVAALTILYGHWLWMDAILTAFALAAITIVVKWFYA